MYALFPRGSGIPPCSAGSDQDSSPLRACTLVGVDSLQAVINTTSHELAMERVSGLVTKAFTTRVLASARRGKPLLDLSRLLACSRLPVCTVPCLFRRHFLSSRCSANATMCHSVDANRLPTHPSISSWCRAYPLMPPQTFGTDM